MTATPEGTGARAAGVSVGGELEVRCAWVGVPVVACEEGEESEPDAPH